jgi:hypothetical protein
MATNEAVAGPDPAKRSSATSFSQGAPAGMELVMMETSRASRAEGQSLGQLESPGFSTYDDASYRIRSGQPADLASSPRR